MRNFTPSIFLLMALNGMAAQLSPSAEQAFRSRVVDLEIRLARQHGKPETYLALLAVEAARAKKLGSQLISGDTLVEPVNGGAVSVGGALLHHWRAAAFVPNATPRDMLALLRDFDHLSRDYAPEIVASRALTDNGETATLGLRMKEQVWITIVLDAEYEIETRLSGNDRGYSLSRSTNIWQVENLGTAHERHRPPGDDDGFLWRLNSYWSFTRAEMGGANPQPGLLVECEAVSLTRDVPPGLGWLVTPIVTDLPRRELEFTLRATRNALKARVAQEKNR